MDFNTMGTFDAKSEIEKNGLGVLAGESKPATIRTTAPFLDVLAHVSERMGISRQAFMSKLVEQLSAEAVADYLSGYADYMQVSDIDASIFADAPDNVDKELLAAFLEQVNHNLLRMRLNAEGIKALPDDNPLKEQYFQNAMKRMGV